jgi:predicted nucleotidyltransferase
VLKWPNRQTVDAAAREWAAKVAAARPDVVRIGYFGSYARGDWGVGSDLDLVIIVERSDRPYVERPAEWRRESLPVPTDLLVYTVAEWAALDRDGRQYRTMERETVWVHSRPRCEVHGR